jgi:hypothetical protein
MNVQLLLSAYGTAAVGGGGGGGTGRQAMFVGLAGLPVFILESPTIARQWFAVAFYFEEKSAATGGGLNASDAATLADSAAASLTSGGGGGTGRQSLYSGGPVPTLVLEASTTGRQALINGTFVNEKV